MLCLIEIVLNDFFFSRSDLLIQVMQLEVEIFDREIKQDKCVTEEENSNNV